MSAPEYPEHLNPFRDSEKPKLKNSLRRSFREITGKIFRQQSFRKKKPVEHIAEEVAIRHPIRNPSYIRTTNVSSMLPDLRGNIEPLPRSRFKERISMNPHINGGATLYRTHEVQSLASLEFFNPFDGSETTPPPTPARRKSKKKAPLPPDSSNENISGDLNHRYRDSKWSLTSNDSENTYFDEMSETSEVNYSLDLSKGLESFTKEMSRLNDDTLNDLTEELVVNSEENRKSSVPDLIVSCPTPQNKEEEEIEEENVMINDTNSKNVQYDKGSGDDVLEKLVKNDSEKDEIELNNNIIIQEVTRFEDATDILNESKCKRIECDNENLDQKNSNTALTDNNDRNEEISLYKQNVNSFKDEGIINIEIEATDEMAGFPNIGLSHEEVFPTDDIVLRYILEDKEQSRKNLGSTHSLKEKSDSNVSNRSLLYLSQSNKEIYQSMESSVPKQRKNKLTKSILMGEQYSEY